MPRLIAGAPGRRRLWWALALLPSAATGGCTSVLVSQSSEIPAAPSHAPNRSEAAKVTAPGMAYALPKGQALLTASRRLVTDDDVAKAKDAATAATARVAADKTALAAAKTQLDEDQKKLAAADADPKTLQAARDDLAKAAALSQVSVNALAIQLGIDQKLATAAAAAADVAPNSLVETAAVEVLPAIPDPNPSHRYVARLWHDGTRSDDVKLTVERGMLSSSTASSTDEKLGIVVNLAKALSIAAGPTKTFALTNLPIELEKTDECRPYEYSAVFDPTDAAQTQKALHDLRLLTDAIIVDVGDRHCADISCELGNVPAAYAPTPVQGIRYRTQTAVHITLAGPQNFGLPASACSSKPSVGSQTLVALVPDSTRTYVLPSEAGAFTTTKFSYAFKEGVPTDYAVTRPSEVAAVASLPIDIAKAILSAPAEILQLKVNYDSQANALIDARVKTLQTQLQALQAQQALDVAAKTAATQGSAP